MTPLLRIKHVSGDTHLIERIELFVYMRAQMQNLSSLQTYFISVFLPHFCLDVTVIYD